MQQKPVYQIHANVNSAHGDAALRVTITMYDENGDVIGHQTWRRHVSVLWVEGMDWTALMGLDHLVKMMADACQTVHPIDDVDVPLF